MVNPDRVIREAVKRAMRERGITQVELAKRLGIKQPSVADLISGRRGKQPQSLLDMLDALSLELTVKEKEPERMDAETKTWLEVDASRLSDYDPYEWEEGELEEGEPVRLSRG
jgi:transcriptional regulator with XRE-family HTH domain